VEANSFREARKDAACRGRIARAEEEMHGRFGRRDKDGAERGTELHQGGKGDGSFAIDDRGAESWEEAAAGSRVAQRGGFRELMEGTHLTGNIEPLHGLAAVPHPGEKGHVTATVERYRLELGENPDATEDYGRLHARRSDRSQLAVARKEHAGCSPTARQRGDEGDAAFVVHHGGRTLAEARDQLARLVRNRIARDRDGRDFPVGLGEEHPLLRLASPYGGIKRRLAAVVGGQNHRQPLKSEAIEASF